MNAPAKGFYYHYKHDANGPISDYAYEVIGVGKQTEDESLLVMYRPLYASEYISEADAFLRPLSMFEGAVTKNGRTFPRFQKITDQRTIAELEAIRDRMY